MEFDIPQPSVMNKWPTKEKPDNWYKIVSSYITLTMGQTQIERQTYSFLEWLGDIGGLFDALRLIGIILMAPFASFKVKNELLSNIFRFAKSKRKVEKLEYEI